MRSALLPPTKAMDMILNPQKVDVAYQKFVKPPVGPGQPAWLSSRRDLRGMGFPLRSQ
ncbi:conserved hypothetical protein [Histoplasma capsulatum G186AR]|uniref:Uncharacterized protein n=1 Tax=Ajellomyces capsulatus (strain G186AR / H82 / ATCC MYA-2454 / RMSCC 2432) TaxID=447093 RepID=C0P0Y8_AJECG|nr:uncharacterized protein HCBG_09068 [Histoplasma capsulatum G186AR]EEH02624.1 conserved hypothetical protein [Histoplasma capsulatum G186AR]